MAEAAYARHFRLLANYHLWAFERLYATVDRLTEEQYRKDVGLFFKSVHGTLNHLLVADRLWFGRHTQNFAPFNGLDEELIKDRAELKAAIFAQARKWIEFVNSLTAAQLLEGFSYTDSHGRPQTRERGPALDHLFNHGTHHRGQISTALTQFGLSFPEMDLLYFDLMKPPQ